jgi:hypothetical protein
VLRQRGAGVAAVAAAALAVWLGVTVPLAAAERTLFFRDVLDNHYALKAFGAAELARGDIPATNPTLGLGQPFRGNPAALAFYPDNLLYLVLPFWSAFNLHFALHWLLAAVAMAVLARRLGLGWPAALLAALTYGGCGWTLSCLSFYNIVTVAAWWPLAMAGAVAGGARGIALGGAACGMALLGGEPVTAALALLPLLVAAVERHGLRRGLAATAAIGALGLAVAAPQLVATLRILPFSMRGSVGVGSLASHFALHPLRLAELVLPLPFGWPLDVGPRGWWLGRTAPNLGYYLSLYGGLVGLWLAARAVRRRPAWAATAVAGIAGAVLLGFAPELVLGLTGGLFRYPEKLLVWYALALPILAAHGLEEALARPREDFRARPAAAAGVLLLAAAAALLLAWPRLSGGGAMPEFASVQVVHLVGYLAVGGILLLAAVAACRRRAGALVAALQLVALLQLAPLVRTAPGEPFSEPVPWQRRLGVTAVGAGPAVLNTLISRPTWEPPPRRFTDAGSRADNYVRNARDLYPATGVGFGLTYPLAPNLEGLASPLHTFLGVEVTRLPWPGRVRWMRAVGVEAAVVYSAPGTGGLTLLDTAVRQRALSRLYAVDRPAPDAWWPHRVEPASGPRAALARVAVLDDPVATVVASRAVAHDPRGEVRLLTERPDRIELAVASPGGGLAVVRRGYHTLWRARLAGGGGEDGELELLPVQITLLGVVVPPGEHRVVLEVDDTPEVLGGLLSVAVLMAVVVVAWRTRP